MKNFITIAVLCVASLCYGQDDRGKKEHAAVNVPAVKTENSRGATKIIHDVPSTDSVVAPPCDTCYECHITFDNYTGYAIDIYIDGNYKGWVEPWGKGEVWGHPGFTWYAESAGGGYSWTNNMDCCAYEWWVNLRY